MNVDIKVIATSTSVLSDKSLVVGFLNSSLELESLEPEFTSDVNIGGLCSHGETNDEGSFYEFVRVISQNLSVLAGSRLRLISVDNQVGGSTNKVKQTK